MYLVRDKKLKESDKFTPKQRQINRVLLTNPKTGRCEKGWKIGKL